MSERRSITALHYVRDLVFTRPWSEVDDNSRRSVTRFGSVSRVLCGSARERHPDAPAGEGPDRAPTSSD
jgi:hypothetical protein